MYKTRVHFGLAWLATHLGIPGIFFCATVGCRPKVPAKPVESVAVETLAPTTTAIRVPKENGEPTPNTAAVPRLDAKPSAPVPFDAGGDWTVQRAIALSEAGPIVVELRVSVGRSSLEAANAELIRAVASELIDSRRDRSAHSEQKDAEPAPDLPEQQTPGDAPAAERMTWDELLELPLVRSGWLGNLVAEAEQRAQLVSMYDTQRDDEVGDEELSAFLSRGLARTAALQVTDIGAEPNSPIGASPWGRADRDGDFSLSAAELSEMGEAIKSYDRNGDGIVTDREVSAANPPSMQNTSMNRTSMLRTTTLMLVESSTPENQARSARKLATDLLRHYTFLPEVSREQWPGWSDAAWALIDTDGNQKLERSELQQLTTMPAAATVYVRLPPLVASQSDEPIARHTDFSPTSLGPRWQPGSDGGLLECNSGSIRILVNDTFSVAARHQFQLQLSQALKNAQLKSQLVSLLQLQDKAFELLDEDGDAALSEAEFQRVWRWLMVRQAGRVSARWMLSARPWFQLSDRDADLRLTEREMLETAGRFSRLDTAGDGLVTPNELPLVASLEINRQDQRLIAPLTQNVPTGSPVSDPDWFSAMDTNRDGSISLGEFLGEKAIFAKMDGDKDGFLVRSEVYVGSSNN